MKRIVAIVVAFCFASGLAMATGPVIGASEIKAAAKAAAAETADREPTENPPNAPTGMTSGTWTAILLGVLVLGAAAYLIIDNSNKHGGNGLLRAQGKAQRASQVQFRRGLLRQQWQTR